MSARLRGSHASESLAAGLATLLSWCLMSAGVASADDAVVRDVAINVGAADGPIEDVKIDNGYVIVLSRPNASKRAHRILLYDRSGDRLARVDPLEAAEGAEDLAVWDVSVGPSGLLAVAAVAVGRTRGNVATLLIYGGGNRLVTALGLEPWREIVKLQVDSDGSIWALGAGAGGKDPALVPAIMRFDSRGQVKDFLPRATLPSRNAIVTEQGIAEGGDIGFGLTAQQVWLYLPLSRSLVTMNKDGGGVTVTPTGEPAVPFSYSTSELPTVLVQRSALLPAEELVAHWKFKTPSSFHSGLYSWRQSTGWLPVSGPAVSTRTERFLGIDGDCLVTQLLGTDEQRVELRWSRLR